ncbi:MAG: hypothetical protein U5O39_11485 [Gammaproteobacteria bacterium]|nr:hypothetical protein [Gammaproteobacteria bacterium]
MLLPEQDIGWFLSTNSAKGPAVRDSFRREFLDRYFTRTEPVPIDMSAEELAKFAGAYGALRHSYDDFTKLVKFLGAITIGASPNTNELIISAGGQVRRVDPSGPPPSRIRGPRRSLASTLTRMACRRTCIYPTHRSSL